MAEPRTRSLITFGTVKNWLGKAVPDMTVMSVERTPAGSAPLIIHPVIVHWTEPERVTN